MKDSGTIWIVTICAGVLFISYMIFSKPRVEYKENDYGNIKSGVNFLRGMGWA